MCVTFIIHQVKQKYNANLIKIDILLSFLLSFLQALTIPMQWPEK